MRNLVEQSIVNDVKKIIERGKKIKDPLKGKRSAYIIFCTKKREEAKKLLNPDAKSNRGDLQAGTDMERAQHKNFHQVQIENRVDKFFLF